MATRRSKPEDRKHRIVVVVKHGDFLRLKSTLALQDRTISQWLRDLVAEAIAGKS